MGSYQDLAERVDGLLTENVEWKERYKDYLDEIWPDSRQAQAIRDAKEQFHIFAPLTGYLTVSGVRDTTCKKAEFAIRLLGHSIATLSIDISSPQGKKEVKFKKDGLKKIIKEGIRSDEDKKDFSRLTEELCDTSRECKWNRSDQKVQDMRKLIRGINNCGGFISDPEHSVETLLLKELNETDGKLKYLINIQPVKLCGFFFQLPTPLAASKAGEGEVSYSGHNGGGIDILARAKVSPKRSELCIIELKDKYEEKEKPSIAIRQAIAYATFILRLIREPEANCGEVTWYKDIFGIGTPLSPSININAVTAMPFPDGKSPLDELPPEEQLHKKPPICLGKDTISLHTLFFNKDALGAEKQEGGMVTSLPLLGPSAGGC